MNIRRVSRLLLATSFAAVLASSVSAADNAAPQNRVVVATVFSKPIYADELELSPSVKLPPGLTEEQRSQWQASQRNGWLNRLIWTPLADQYCQSHDCEPTDEEIAAFNQFLERSKQMASGVMQKQFEEWKSKRATLVAEQQSPNVSEGRGKEIREELKQLDSLLAIEATFHDSMAPKQPVAADRDIARASIRAWKFNKALYEKYGGPLIFQQANPIEPLGAYRAWLEEHEGKGDFQILDPKLRTAFWDYYVSTEHNFIDLDKLLKEKGLKSPFEKPWWQLPPDEEKSAK